MKNLYPNFFRLLLAIISLSFIANYSIAQSSQLRNAGLATSVTGAPCGNAVWNNVANATGIINNGTFARSNPAVNTNSACLELTNMGFSIPAGATILGVKVDIRRTTDRGNTNDVNVQLIKGGAKTGTNKAVFNNWPQALTTVAYGGASDLWGTTLTTADINATNFGFSFVASRSGGTTAPNIDVDGIEMTVYYTYLVSGTVFRDYNSNGVINTTGGINEKGVAGISVKATMPDGSFVTATTDAAGFYGFTTLQIPASTNVRLEFLNLPNEDFSSSSGTDNNSSVQFINTGSTVTANYGINTPDDFWDNVGQSNPKLLAIVYAHGDINHTNSANTAFGIQQIDNNTTGHTPTLVNVATQAQVGSLWGMGYQKNQNRYFFSNFLKRHIGFGPKGVGGVYMANLSGANYALSGSFTLQGVTPTNGGGVLDMGSVNRVSTPNTSDFYLATASDPQGKDLDAFAKAGKVGFGDIEVDDKNQQLVLINLNQRKLITVNIAGGTSSLNNASAATLGPLTRAYDILSLPGIPSYNTSTQGQLRPFALKIYKGRGYLGITGDASVTPRDSTNLIGYILSFDPTNIEAGFTNELTVNFNYRTSSSNGNTNRWHSWADVWSNVRSSGLYRYPEPLISDIEFDENGGMNISISDRFCHQMGIGQTAPVAGSTTVIDESRESGDILHVCRVGNSWVMEGSAGSCTPVNTVDNADGYGDGQTVGVREWYDDQSGDNNVGEFTQGAMAKLMGSNLVVQTMQDPTSGPNTTGEPYYYSAGMHWFNVNTGGWSNWTSVYDGSDAGSPGGGFMKGNALGDIEFATNPQSIQIGNRIWTDANANGVQDPGEAGINSVAVELVSPGPDGIFGNGDDVILATTNTATINGQAGSYFFSSLTTQDARKPASWTGVSNILPGYNYQIRIANASGGSQQAALAGLQLTRNDAAANSIDNIDNDAVLSSTSALVTFNTNNTNHNFDIGFKPQASLGDKVWRDDDKDGIQDSGEPGVAGITVTLYQNGADGIPGTTDDIVLGTTVTDAYGNYLFDNLTPSTNGNASTMYNVGFTLPANYQFTTQTNTQNNTATNVGNTTTTSGGSTAANGSDANINTGRTGSFFLVAGEAERGADGGIVFNSPVATNSIGNRVWLDTDLGGDQDANEPGVAGVTVTLYAADGITIVATTVTDVNGNYLFTGLPANTNYIVGVTPPAGTLFTTSGGTTPANDTDSDVSTALGSSNYGKSTLVNTGVAGTNTLTIDAGLIPQPTTRASLGDRVWYDNDRDGVQDALEPGISGVLVELLDAGANSIDPDGAGPLTQTLTRTDALGNYIFPNLLPATYRVKFANVAGMQRTILNSTGGTIPDATDSDADVSSSITTGYSLVAGEKNMSVDAGYYSTQPAANVGALGDKVWNDLDGDGIQDANEPGVAGVTVTLYNSAGIAIANTVTDANGYYLFPNLTPGNYSVGFSNLPIGFGFTGQDKGGNDATDSDANPATGRTAQVAVVGGNTNTTVDAGIRQGNNSGLGSLGDRVWYDLNNNGDQDAGELGVAGVTVNLYNDVNNDGVISGAELTPIKTTTTNALGEYLFDGLNAGNYQVGFTLPTALSTYALSTTDAGATDAVDSDGNPKNTSIAGNTAGAQTSYTGLISLAQGEDNLSVDLGIVPPANTNTLGGTAWFDTDSDGLQAGNPARVPGVLVTLYNNAGVAIATTTTDENGDYLFVGLADGTYSVGFSNYPTGYDVTTREGTNTAAGGSDPDRVSGRTSTVTLDGTNRNDRSLDAGLVSPRAALGNYIWDDLNRDGIQDAGETPVAGVTVSLYFDANNDGSINGAEATTPVATAITDADGKYFFPNLTPGNYQVGFTTIPTGMEFTTQDNVTGPNGDGVNSNGVGGDSDVSPSTGRTGIINLSPSEVDLTVDAGIRVTLPATIGNKVWADINTDGIQDAGEPGIAGVFVTLYNSSNQPIGSAVTDGNGNWQITNIPTGTGYYIIFTSNLPNFDITGSPGSNPAWTSQNIGANGTQALDSGSESDTDSDVTSSGANAGRTGTFSIVPGNNFPNIDAGIINWPANNILPIQLVSFTAQPQNSSVILYWVVDAETNVAHYEVEYSTNGINFVSIGSRTAIGNRNYSLPHSSPKQGLNYYRLKVIDKDGKVSYSEIRKVNFGIITGAVKVYPTPAVNSINITVTTAMINQYATISVIAMDGKLVYQQTVNALSQTETINVSKLASGKYVLHIITNNETVNRPIQIIK